MVQQRHRITKTSITDSTKETIRGKGTILVQPSVLVGHARIRIQTTVGVVVTEEQQLEEQDLMAITQVVTVVTCMLRQVSVQGRPLLL